MEFQARVSFSHGRSGSRYIAELRNDRWRFSVCEWGDVVWWETPETPELIEIAEARLRGLVLSRAA